MQALKAGCHVLMEKPMVTDSGQAHELDRRAAALHARARPWRGGKGRPAVGFKLSRGPLTR